MPIPSFQHRSRGFGHGVVASTISYNAVIVLSVVLCDCCKPTSNCRDRAFSNSGLEVGLPALQLPCSQNVTHCGKQMCSTCWCKTSIPAVPFWNSKHPLSTRSRFLRAAVGSTSSAISCLHHFDPFVAAARKARLMQRSRVFGNGVAVSKICYNAVIALSVVLCDCCKPKNSCRD